MKLTIDVNGGGIMENELWVVYVPDGFLEETPEMLAAFENDKRAENLAQDLLDLKEVEKIAWQKVCFVKT